MEQKQCPGCMEIKSGTVCEHCGYDERRQNAPHQLQAGTVLQGRYLVGRALGQGGFGITYLGWNQYLETRVAIKEYYPSVFVERNATYNTSLVCKTQKMVEPFQENRMRFLREARTLAKLQEVPQIVSIHDFFEVNNTAYIVMEYLQGSDLRDYVKKRGGRLTAAETLSILRPVMAALVKVHEAGLVHRDISPDNIMLQHDGSVKLMDFGAVRTVNNPDVDKELTQATQAIAKRGFAPIEQYSEKGSIGPWTDEYALCATVYYCMTGRVPESAPDRIMEGSELDWEQIDGLTTRQKQILRKGTAIHAKDRYSSIRELMDALFAQTAQADAELEAAKREAERKEAERREAEKLEAERREAERLEAARREAERLEAERLEAERREAEQRAAEKLKTTPKSGKNKRLLLLGAIVLAAVILGVAIAPKNNSKNNYSIDEFAQRDTVNTGALHTVGLKSDGSVVAVGNNTHGQCDVSDWRDIVAVSAGELHTVGLKSDGTVMAVGYNGHGQCDVTGWRDIVAVSAGGTHTVGLKSDGTAVAVGDNWHGQCNVSGWRDIVAVSAGTYHTVGLKSDGTAVAAGDNGDGRCKVSGWRDIVAVSAGATHTVGLKSDGSVVAVGNNTGGQCNVKGWRDIVVVSAGGYHTVGLKSDGTVVATGWNDNGQCDVSDWRDIVAVSAGTYHTVGLKSDGTVVAVGNNGQGQRDVSGWKDIRMP